MPAIIELEHVEKSFRGTSVLRTVNATFEAGRCHAIIGPNGAGKSVLLRIICGLMQPQDGTVRRSSAIADVKGIVPGSIGAVIDRPAFLPFATGLSNLKDLASILRKATDDDIFAAFDAVGLDPKLKQHVRSYSLGMKQKLGLAQAIMENPTLLVLDEPFNALDADSVTRVRSLIKSRLEAGTTVIFTSHNAEDIDLLADHVWQLDRGALTAQPH